ncbi:MAG TPA: zinc-dependent metalloprotease [Chitinophagaceae bacterium]|nr:zinc-dependent metalloprotease [Chitinophagaceae bacterium]
MRKLFVIPVLLLVSAGSFAQDKPKPPTTVPADTAKPAAPKKPAGIQDKVKSSRKIDGLFTVYQDTTTGSVQLYIKKNQLGKEFIYQSFSLNGPTSLFLHRNMLRTNAAFRVQKAYDKLEFAIANHRFYYDKNNAISKTAGVDVPEAIFLSEKVSGEDENGYLINADGLFLAEKMDPVKPLPAPGLPPGLVFSLGGLNPTKSKYNSIKSYPNNTNVIVDLAYDNPAPFNPGGKDITDARYVRVCMQHSFIEMPQNNYRARRDDPRVGYFISEVNDQTTMSATPFRDVIHRWHLEKKDPSAAMSEPVEPIVWWIENTTPVEYRSIVMEAGNKWNEAFEKAGFKNAVVMKIQPDDADWDAGDIRYNVIKWVSSPYPPYGAIGMHSINPKTGQIIAGDIVIEWASASSSPLLDELYGGPPTNAYERRAQLTANLPGVENMCALSGELREQFMSGLTALEAAGASDTEIREMHRHFLYYLIMHELGHTLGLNHNMRSSQMLKPSELNNKDITRKIGLMGSVMDYPAPNIALDRSKQGDYYTTKAGPYDIWAIEFGYTPCAEGEEKAVLEKILSRSTDPHLAFGNDADDMRSPGKAIDPRVNIFDMSSDAIGFAEQKFQLIKTTMGKLKDKYSKPGKSYAELRSRFNVLNNQRFDMASAVSRYVGGVYIDRSFVGQQTQAKPMTPVPLATQKRAIEVLNKYMFAPDAFAGDEQVYPYLQLQRRGFNFFTSTEDIKLTSNYANIQNFSALAHILHPTTLQRITNTRLYGNQYSVAEVMGDLTKGIFNADLAGKVNVYRQYLQTQYVKTLANIVNPAGPVSPYDEVAKAAALYTLKKIRTTLTTAVSPDEETKAHRSNLQFLIEKALKAD